MTKEISDIVAAYRAAQQDGRKCALATVVHVEGSSYRNPGARMLIEDDGRITGAISGGCLEGDARRRALLAIASGHNKLITYNTLHEDDLEFGVQLGCNGIVHILFEPIEPGQANNPVAILERFFRERKPAVIVTLFSLAARNGAQPGTCFFTSHNLTVDNVKDAALAEAISADATRALQTCTSSLLHYEAYGLSAFAELVQPPVWLVVAGAGNDVMPLAAMASLLGWQLTIIDGRATHATRQRFPQAHKVIAGKPTDALKQITTDERTAFVLMTHNYNYDLAMMKLLLPMGCAYIGALGPAKRLERMLAEAGEIPPALAQRAAIYGPTGLDIGAETPEEIALSILAEIKAIMAGRQGGQLRQRQAGIHSRPAQVVVHSSNIFLHAQ